MQYIYQIGYDLYDRQVSCHRYFISMLKIFILALPYLPSSRLMWECTGRKLRHCRYYDG